jgi:hypothetical protein
VVSLEASQLTVRDFYIERIADPAYFLRVNFVVCSDLQGACTGQFFMAVRPGCNGAYCLANIFGHIHNKENKINGTSVSEWLESVKMI